MAANLKTDYKDYIPPEGGKRYIITTDAQGYSTIQDATEYTQEGDAFGAGDINATNTAVNSVTGLVPYGLNIGERIADNGELNDYVNPGTYYCPAPVSATLSNTPIATSGIHLIVQYVTGNQSLTQTIVAGNGLIYHRYYYSGSFGAWQQVLTAENNGFFGSNQYGYWQKLPGGRMIAWGTASSGAITAGGWKDISFSFPLVFSAAPFITATPKYDASRDIALNVGGSSTDGAWCHVYFGGSGSDSVGINWIAIGSY